MAAKFQQHCNQFRTDDIDKANFQFQPGGIDKGLKLSVPNDKLAVFWDNYYEFKVKHGVQSHLLERPNKQYNMLKIDLDLKHDATQDDMQSKNPRHKYTHELLQNVIQLYASSVCKYIKLPEPCNFTIFEKKYGKIKGQEKETNTCYVKDGIHIMCPEIIVENAVLHAIYDTFIKDPKLAEIYGEFKMAKDENPASTFDPRVICTNSWYPIGSGKPDDNKDYYIPTKTFTVTLDKDVTDTVKVSKTDLCFNISILLLFVPPDVVLSKADIALATDLSDEILQDNLEILIKTGILDVVNDAGVAPKYKLNGANNAITNINVRICEIIKRFTYTGKDKNVVLLDTLNLNNLSLTSSQRVSNKQQASLKAVDKMMLQKLVPTKDLNKKPLDIRYIEHLLSCLDRKRCSTYDSWFKIGICLYNISPYLITMFDKWSAQVPEKYDADSIYRYWYENFTKNCDRYSLGLDKLKQYAKEDNESMYYKIVNLHRTKFMDDMVNDINNGMHKDRIAHVDLTKKLKEYIELHCEWQVKCADNTSNTWYKFEGHRWRDDKGANKIYQMLTDDILRSLRSRWEFFNDKIEGINSEISNIATRNVRDSSGPVSGEIAMSPNMFNRSNLENQLEEHINQTNNLTLQKQQLLSAMQNTAKLSSYIQGSANRNNIIKDLSQECFDRDFYTNLDTNPHVFICNNCVLDLEEGKIRPGLPKDMSTLCCNIDFPHDTNSEEAQRIFCEIEEFLDKIFPDSAIQDYILNLFAEALSGFIRREEFYIHTGSGGNGKSLLGMLLLLTFGEYYYGPDSTIFNTPKSDPNAPNPIIANVRGKRIVMTTEPKTEKGLQSDIIKQYSGCDPITGRHLNKEPITFSPQCKWNMQCNNIPEIDSFDGGVTRRICIIPYQSKFVAPDDITLADPVKYPNHYPKDPAIKSKLNIWAPYFLAMLWQRFLKLKDSGFVDLSESRRPDAVCEATKTYMAERNIYASFCENKMEYKCGYRQQLAEVFLRFKDYLREIESNKKIDGTVFEMHIKSMQCLVNKVSKTKWIYDRVIIGQGEKYSTDD